MSPTIRQHCALLGVALILLISAPVCAAGVVDSQATDDTCCAGELACESDHEPSGTNQPLDEDCCPSGCDNCFLQCCNGVISLHAYSMTLDPHHSSPCTWLEDCDQAIPTDPRAVYHPPRS